MIDEIRNTKGLFRLRACFPYLMSLYSKTIFIVHCTVRETTNSLEVNLSFLFCRKELWRRRGRLLLPKATKSVLCTTTLASPSAWNYYCLEKARLASHQLGASSNGWHLICGREKKWKRNWGIPFSQSTSSSSTVHSCGAPRATILGRRRHRECMTTA